MFGIGLTLRLRCIWLGVVYELAQVLVQLFDWVALIKQSAILEQFHFVCGAFLLRAIILLLWI